jgi:hydrogenase maturation factor
MCLGEVGRVARLLDERTAVVRCGGRDITAALDVVLAEGGTVVPGDVVVVSMGFVLALSEEDAMASRLDLAGPEGVGR